MKITDLVGAYELQSFEIEDASGAVKQWGSNARGLLIYEPGGRMSVSIIRDAASPRPSDWEPLDDVLFYAGSFSSPSPGIVEHRVAVATERERIGQTMVRNAQISGKLLQISNKTASGGTARLVWSKLG